MPLIWLEQDELEAVIRSLSADFENWKWRPWAPHCHRALSKLVEVMLKERRKDWNKYDVETFQD